MEPQEIIGQALENGNLVIVVGKTPDSVRVFTKEGQIGLVQHLHLCATLQGRQMNVEFPPDELLTKGTQELQDRAQDYKDRVRPFLGHRP